MTVAQPGRVIGIDLGSRRIGVAVSDPSRLLASPHTVIERASERGGGRATDHRRLSSVIDEVEAVQAVVGLPLSLDGTEGRAAQAVRDEIEELMAVLEVPVAAVDERFTTVTANRSMIERKMSAPERRRVVDQVAAAVLLQHWLDGERHRRDTMLSSSAVSSSAVSSSASRMGES